MCSKEKHVISIRNSQSMEFALSCPLDSHLRLLLKRRLDMLSEFSDFDLSELAQWTIVEPGDSIATIEAELGFSPFVNFVDEARYPDLAYQPSWEWLIAHGTWFELCYALSDSGFGIILLVPNRPDVEPALLELFDAFATWRSND